MDKTEAVTHRLTRRLTIGIMRGRRIDNEIHAGGMGGMARACTWAHLLMTTVCQTCTGTREGSHKGDNQLENYQRDEGHGAAQWSFWSGRTLSGQVVRPAVRASWSSPPEHS